MKTLINHFDDLLSQKLSFIDVGARSGIPTNWEPFTKLMNVISFEPDRDEYNTLSKNKKDNETLINSALSSTDGTAIIYLTRERACSSLYRPNEKFLVQFPESDRFTVEKIEVVKASRLDSLFNSGLLGKADFIKIDTQGSELEVLRGGKNLLKNVLGIEIEVEFAPMYENQPLFRDVDEFISTELGLHIMDLRKTYWKPAGSEYIGSPKGQLIFADALYLRPTDEIIELSLINQKDSDVILKCVLIYIAYGYFDYALKLLDRLEITTILDEKNHALLKKSLQKNARNYSIPFLMKKTIPKIYTVINTVRHFFPYTRKGWGISEQRVGTRKRFGVFDF